MFTYTEDSSWGLTDPLVLGYFYQQRELLALLGLSAL